jgi:hypothetical protein
MDQVCLQLCAPPSILDSDRNAIKPVDVHESKSPRASTAHIKYSAHHQVQRTSSTAHIKESSWRRPETRADLKTLIVTTYLPASTSPVAPLPKRPPPGPSGGTSWYAISAAGAVPVGSSGNGTLSPSPCAEVLTPLLSALLELLPEPCPAGGGWLPGADGGGSRPALPTCPSLFSTNHRIACIARE